MVLMGRAASRLITEGRKSVVCFCSETKISIRQFLTSIEVRTDVPRAELDSWLRKRSLS
jgi:hypothetical protein